MHSAMKEKLKKMILKAIIIYCVVMTLMYVFQRKLMYFPDKTLLAPVAYNVEAEVRTLITADNARLVAWEMPAAEGMPTILHMHGNAGNISYRSPVYNAFHAAGYGVLALEWRGYGVSTEIPSEEGFYTDARTAIEYLKEQGLAESDIILYGESIGTGVAVQMATEIDSQAVILEAPFTSLWKRAQEIHWYMPVKYLVKDRYDNLAKIDQVKAPLIIFHNEVDRIVPSHHGKALYEAANDPKKLEIVDAHGHVEFDRPWQVEKVKAFLR